MNQLALYMILCVPVTSMAAEHTFMPVHIIPDVTKEVLKSSVYSFIYGELIGGAHKKIRADKPDEQYLHWAPEGSYY